MSSLSVRHRYVVAVQLGPERVSRNAQDFCSSGLITVGKPQDFFNQGRLDLRQKRLVKARGLGLSHVFQVAPDGFLNSQSQRG